MIPFQKYFFASDGQKYSLSDFTKTPKLVLYFYPQDDTPGCTKQATEFTKFQEDFFKKGITVVGVSPDSVESHRAFVEKYQLTLLLLSDPEKELATEFGAFGEKRNYGKKYMGIIRSTFLIDTATHEILASWKNVRATGHVERILQRV